MIRYKPLFVNNSSRTGVCTASCERSYEGIGSQLPRQMFEGTTKNAHTQVKREKIAKIIDFVLFFTHHSSLITHP